MHHSRHTSGRASLKIGDTWCLMHTSATVLLTRPRRESTSRTQLLALSGPNPRPVLSRRLVLQSAPHHPISELHISELPRSKHIPPFSPPPRCRVIRPCCYTLCIRTSVASAMVCCSHRAPLSLDLLPADGRETLHPALAAGQAHCSSELRSFGAASTPARRGRPGEGDRRQHLLRYGQCPWPCRAAARAARAAPGKLKLCQ